MGNRGGAGGSGGNTGADAGFFVSQDKKKSKLSKKNQDIVDAKFEDRGAVKISQGVKGPPSVRIAGAILSKPLQVGSKKTREFFTEKVLTSDRGMKNLGTTKEEFSKMSVSQQESIYGDYIKGRTSGDTDAYGNKIGTGRDDSSLAARTKKKSIKSIEQPKVASQMDNTGVKSDLITADKTAPTNVEMTDDEYTVARNKKGRKRTVLTSVTGDTTKPTLSKKTLLG